MPDTLSALPVIPFVDIRNATPLALMEQHADKAEALLNASRDAFGLVSRVASYAALPLGDSFSRRWLDKTNNPYRAEIEAYTRHLPVKGVYALNLCYEWGCTSAAYHLLGSAPVLTRVLDWPFPALGQNMVIAHQSGSAGEFYNVTWPGVSGVFQAMAPGRFAAALNQAPMRRYRTGIAIDWLRNRARINRQSGLPPAHLLRLAFETAPSYATAKQMLAEHPVSIPVIYTLSGTAEDEGCVIERLEDRAVIREMRPTGASCAANHFESSLNGIGFGWRPRALESDVRAKQGSARKGSDIDAHFGWFTTPIANPLSRLAMAANAGSASLSVMGTEGAQPATQIWRLEK